jgi:hypothetical protein
VVEEELRLKGDSEQREGDHTQNVHDGEARHLELKRGVARCEHEEGLVEIGEGVRRGEVGESDE